jgi:hypothetical protein
MASFFGAERARIRAATIFLPALLFLKATVLFAFSAKTTYF